MFNKEDREIFIVKAESGGFHAGNFADISINDIPVFVEKYNIDNEFRGLYIVIINPQTGFVEFTKVFDTYKSSAEFEQFIQLNIPKGHIVVAACKDECS